MQLRGLLCLALTFCAISTSTAQDRWPEWRGESGQGVSAARGLPVKWSEKENIAWKVKIPGLGWSTPVIDQGQVWVTTAVDRLASKEDADRRRSASTNSQPLRISEWVSLRAVGIALDSGKRLQDVETLSVSEPQMIHVDNSYATPTPILEDGLLYCHYGTLGTACLDTRTGHVVWRNQELRIKHENGPGSSPILWKDRLVVHCDGIDQQYIVALDKHTGKIAWRTSRSGEMRDDPQLKKSYATPLVVDVKGTPQVVSPAADWLYGYDPLTRKELWRLPYGQLGFSNAPRPVFGVGTLFACTGYMKSQLLAIEIDRQNKPKVRWRYQRQVPNVSSPVLVGNEIYFVSDKGIATCLDARTGMPHWTQRIGKNYWASPIYADGRIYFFSKEAKTTVVVAGKRFKQLAVNQLEGTMLATAAAVNGMLVLRTDKAVYGIRAN